MSVTLSGVLTALAIPFDSNGDLDVPVLKAIVDRSVDAGVGGVVACGSTGEVGALTSDERLKVVETVVERTAGRAPVIAQTGATSTREAIRLSKAAEAAGADMVMLVTPYYEPITLEETAKYLKDVASSVELPVMLYNIPGATGVNFAPDFVRELATDIPNVRYIKDSSANYEQNLELIHHHSDVIGTIVGWDAYAYSSLVEGAAAVMAGAANVVPSELVAVAKAVGEGDLAGGFELWRKVYPVMDHLLTTAFIPGIKAGLKLQGLDAGVPRLPMLPYSEEETARLAELLDALK
ncbi:MAG: 4-hydroxy-tetrahydrodipicolinate synthase [Tessaracoccus sp.]